MGASGILPIKAVGIAVGMLRSLWGAYACVTGMARITSGFYISKAAQFILALGEDGLDFAGEYMAAAKHEQKTAGNGFMDDHLFNW